MRAEKILAHPVYCTAFGFGSGLSPVAPGTFGTLAAVPIYYFLLAPLPPMIYCLVLVLAFFLGIYLCGRTAQFLGVHDHGGIVWDEFVGYWLTLFLVPLHWWWMLLGFLLFRLFDIWKPWPIKQFDRQVAGGFGIMLDDVVAGIYAGLCLQLIIWLVR